MSVSAELQKAIRDRLIADPAVQEYIGDRVYDQVPDHPFGTDPDNPQTYVSFGPHDVVEDDADCIVAGEHTFQLDIWSRYKGGFLECKQAGDAVKKSLHDFETTLAVNALVEMRVTSVRYLRDRDGLTSHGVVTVTAMIEEAD